MIEIMIAGNEAYRAVTDPHQDRVGGGDAPANGDAFDKGTLQNTGHHKEEILTPGQILGEIDMIELVPPTFGDE